MVGFVLLKKCTGCGCFTTKLDSFRCPGCGEFFEFEEKEVLDY